MFPYNLYSTPMEDVTIDECTAHAVRDGSLCQYYEFVNDDSAKGFAVNVDNFFDSTMVDFWDELLERKTKS